MNARLLLILAIVISGLFYLRAAYAGSAGQIYLLKPLTTLLIIFLAWRMPGSSLLFKRLILAGLFFSLAGDVFLMLPQDRFIAGLISFLVAHLFYIAAFVSSAGFQMTAWPLGAYLLYGALMLLLLWPHLGALRLPVLVYMAVILVMGWQGLERGLFLNTQGAWLAAAGAAFFVASDSLLALDRFRGQFPAATALVMITYWTAQTLLALSVGK